MLRTLRAFIVLLIAAMLAASVAAQHTPKGSSPDQLWNALVAGNRRFVSGKAEATRGDIPIGVLGPGTFFGEMSLLENKPRVATVTTTEPTSVLVLTAREFDLVVKDMPAVDRKILVVLAERLREVEERYVPVDARVVSKDIA